MTGKDIVEKLDVDPQVVNESHHNPLVLLSSDEFNSPLTTGSYRERAVKRAIKSKVSFSNETNCTMEMAKVLLKATCPYCHKTLKASGGGGVGCGPFSITSINFHCEKCKVSVNLYLHEGSLNFCHQKD